MTDYPTDPVKRKNQRARLRREMRARLTAEMETRVAQAGVSLKCGGYSVGIMPLHAGTPNGCANDGSTCLCECHDERPTALVRPRGVVGRWPTGSTATM